MIINLHRLLGLPVYTESGIKLGKVFDFELDVENHLVLRYLIRQNFLSIKYFLIQSGQIKEIRDTKIVVDDSVVKMNSEEAAPVAEE